jgi:hypothetical protein
MIPLKPLFVPLPFHAKKGIHLVCRRDVHLPPDIPKGGDDLNHQSHFLFSFLIIESLLWFWKRRHHDRPIFPLHRKPLPYLFGDKGHEGMEHPKDAIKNVQEGHLRQSLLIQILILIEERLDQFKIPVAEFMPDELIEVVRGFVKLVFFDGLLNRADRLVQPSTDPSIREAQITRLGNQEFLARFQTLQIHQGKARSIPDLIDKMAVPFCSRF